MTAFGSADRLASRVGVCPGNNESAGRRKSGRVRKGNPTVRRLLCAFAHAASRTQSVFKAKFQAFTVLSWTRARRHRHRPQATAHDLHYAKAWRALPGFHHRLRDAVRATQCAALDQGPDSVRLHHARRRLIITSPHAMALLGQGPARLAYRLFRAKGSGKPFLTTILRRQPWFSRTPFLSPDEIAARLGDLNLQAPRDRSGLERHSLCDAQTAPQRGGPEHRETAPTDLSSGPRPTPRALVAEHP